MRLGYVHENNACAALNCSFAADVISTTSGFCASIAVATAFYVGTMSMSDEWGFLVLFLPCLRTVGVAALALAVLVLSLPVHSCSISVAQLVIVREGQDCRFFDSLLTPFQHLLFPRYFFDNMYLRRSMTCPKTGHVP